MWIGRVSANGVRIAGGMTQLMGSEPPPKIVRPLEETRLRQQALGAKLRQLFDEVVSEPVPDEFLEILRRGDEGESGNADG
jgi:hypothetical protein